MSHLVTSVLVDRPPGDAGAARRRLNAVPRGLAVGIPGDHPAGGRDTYRRGKPVAQVLSHASFAGGRRMRFMGVTMSPLMDKNTHQAITVGGLAEAYFHILPDGALLHTYGLGEPVYVFDSAANAEERGLFTMDPARAGADPTVVGYFVQPTGQKSATICVQPDADPDRANYVAIAAWGGMYAAVVGGGLLPGPAIAAAAAGLVPAPGAGGVLAGSGARPRAVVAADNLATRRAAAIAAARRGAALGGGNAAAAAAAENFDSAQQQSAAFSAVQNFIRRTLGLGGRRSMRSRMTMQGLPKKATQKEMGAHTEVVAYNALVAEASDWLDKEHPALSASEKLAAAHACAAEHAGDEAATALAEIKDLGKQKRGVVPKSQHTENVRVCEEFIAANLDELSDASEAHGRAVESALQEHNAGGAVFLPGGAPAEPGDGVAFLHEDVISHIAEHTEVPVHTVVDCALRAGLVRTRAPSAAAAPTDAGDAA